jgi:hypothetical protein
MRPDPGGIMPVHDWTRLDHDIFHAFHTSWITHLMDALNAGVLPPDYYALSEQEASRGRRAAIRHNSGHRLVATIEIVSPTDKDGGRNVREMTDKVIRTLESGVQVMLLDLLPPMRHDPHGIHGAVWSHYDATPYEPPTNAPLTLASYVWQQTEPTAYLEPVAVGQALIDMPLFLNRERYVSVPLEATYQGAYRGLPQFWRRILEQTEPPDNPPGGATS